MRPTKKNKVLHPVPSLVFTSILIATTAAPAWALGGPWKPRQTLNVQGGHGMQGYYDALLPLVGDAEHMFYANGALAGTHHENGGDLGLGYRRIILNNQYVAGGFVLMGRYRTNYHNMFNQLTLGTELFGTTWEARAHLYPLIGKRNKFVSKRSEGFSFQGHKLLGIETTTYEHAEGGGDIEIGRVIPNVPKLRGFAGYYHNGLGNNEHKNVNGGYGRFEYRYNSHFTFTLADAYDRYQGNFFAIGVRINIGAPAENKEPLTADQRMTDYSVRRRNIFTYTTANSIPFSSTENFYFVAGPSLSGDGSYEAPYGSIQEAIAAANADPSSNNYVYVCNCSNTASYTYDLGGQLDIGPTTKLIGSGGTFTYNNTVVPSLCGNARPTLIGGLLLPGNNEVTNFNITGIGAPTNQTTAITVNGGNVSLNNLDIYGYTGGPSIAGIDGINPGDSGTAATPGTAAYGILVNNASNVLINQVNISNINGSSGANGGNGADGTSFPTDTNGGNGGNGASGTAAYGIMLNNSSSVLISDVNISNINGGSGGLGGFGGNNGGNTANGGIGGNGGSGGDAIALSIDGSTQVNLAQLTISGLNAGNGQAGGAGGISGYQAVSTIPGGNGGSGGNATGLSLNNIASLSLNSINFNGAFNAGSGAQGGIGGNGGGTGSSLFNAGNGGIGGNGGDGGSSTGSSFNNITSLSLSSVNLNASFTAGAGGMGGLGGNGGNQFGTAAAGTGGVGGNAGSGGTASGLIFNTISSLSLNSATISGSFTGGAGGTGGTGGTGGGNFSSGAAGNGGNGGNGAGGGGAYGIQSGGTTPTNVTFSESLTAGAGGSLGAGGSGGTPGTGGTPGGSGNPGAAGTTANIL